MSDAPPAPGRWPDFLVIGAMKGGSSSLYRHLEEHPSLFLSHPKEPEYWSARFAEPGAEAWYRGLFAAARPDQLCGEASTGYSRWPRFGDVAARIAGVLPRVRVIYQLRHPAQRAVSHWQHRRLEHQLAAGRALGFDDAVARWPEILDASRYASQLARYEACFPREQILLLTLDDLERDPAATLAEVQRFLGVPFDPEFGRVPIRANVGGEWAGRRRIAQGLAAVSRAPVLGPALRLFPPSWREAARRSLRRSTRLARWLAASSAPAAAAASGPAALPEGRYARLLEEFEPDVRRVEAWLGRSLPAWRR